MRFTVSLERLLPENVRHLAAVEQVFSDGPQQIRRWTLLSAGAAATARLRCLALVSLGRWQMSRLAGRVMPLLAADPARPVQVEFVLIRHAPQERLPHSPSRHHQGWRLLAGGRWEALARPTLRCQVPGVRQGGVESGRSQTGRLLLGYGRSIQVGADGFGLHPDQRWRRCAGLFESESRVTDPVAFLKRLHHKSQYRAGRARAVLDRLKDGLSDWLGWDVAQSLERGDLEAQWKSTPRARQVPAMVALDIARHAFDAAARLGETNPLRQPGVVLFERLGALCPAGQQAAFVRLLDGWFPNLQFILALDAGRPTPFPATSAAAAPAHPRTAAASGAGRAPTVAPRSGAAGGPGQPPAQPGLDEAQPSLQGAGPRRGIASRDQVAATGRDRAGQLRLQYARFGAARRVLRRHYGSALQLGGSGVDLRLRLEPEIEALAPDYSLYPELGDRALGFLTRGCPLHCPFCVVPIKEGAPRQVSDLDGLLQGRRKLILLDDNLLAHPDALRLLEEMVRRGLAVNFNQTLDLRLLTPEAAALLRRLRLRQFRVHPAQPVFQPERRPPSRADAAALRPAPGAPARTTWRLSACMASTPRWRRTWRGFGSCARCRARMCSCSATCPCWAARRRITAACSTTVRTRCSTELVRIVFRQNMKSMETYYRWLAIQYAAQCGRIHSELVETLFRYNARPRMGRFVARLEALCRQAPDINCLPSPPGLQALHSQA